jgi:hypothetical protein
VRTGRADLVPVRVPLRHDDHAAARQFDRIARDLLAETSREDQYGIGAVVCVRRISVTRPVMHVGDGK